MTANTVESIANLLKVDFLDFFQFSQTVGSGAFIMMIRSCRIPHVLSRICVGDDVIQTAMLVTNDGELLGSTSTTYVNTDGNRESSENLGTLIADIAVDYQRLGDEYANLDPSSSTAASGGVTSPASTALSGGQQQGNTAQSPQPPTPTQPSSATSASTASSSNNLSISNTNTTNTTGSSSGGGKKGSHLQFLLLELEQGLIGVSTCAGIDCMVIAIASNPNAPPGMIKARLTAMAEHAQEALSPLTESVSYR